MQLIPYVEVNGLRSITDDQLIDIWLEMEGNSLHRVVFPKGEVQNEREWIAYCKTPSNLMHVFFDDNAVPLGIYWLNHIEENRALGHFCTLPIAWADMSEELSRQSVAYWFGDGFMNNGKPLIEVILGEIPATNTHAVRHVKRIGFAKLGTIPEVEFGGKKTGSTIVFMTKKYWIERG